MQTPSSQAKSVDVLPTGMARPPKSSVRTHTSYASIVTQKYGVTLEKRLWARFTDILDTVTRY